MVKLKVKRLVPEAKIPSYSHKGDACMDIYAVDKKENEMLNLLLISRITKGKIKSIKYTILEKNTALMKIVKKYFSLKIPKVMKIPYTTTDI